MVKLILENGMELDIKLDQENAPISCANFLDLVDKNFYDGIIFHRIIKDFMAQTGGYKVEVIDGKETLVEVEPSKTIKGEFKSNGVDNNLKHKLGVISMARTSIKDSASSQFFITTKDTPHLDGEYAAFGEVVNGFDTLDYLNNVTTVNVGGGLTDFAYPVVRIKTIKRI